MKTKSNKNIDKKTIYATLTIPKKNAKKVKITKDENEIKIRFELNKMDLLYLHNLIVETIKYIPCLEHPKEVKK